MIAGVATRDIPLTELVWLRYVFHLLLMFVILAPRTGTGFVRTRRPILHLARSLLMVVMPVSYILGSRYVPGGPFMGIFWIAPVLVLVFARMIGERPSLVTWGAVLAGWVAALGLYRPSIAAMGWPALYPLAMAASFSLYIVLTRVLDRTEGVWTNLFYSAAGVLAALTPVLPLVWRLPTPAALAVSAAVGTLGFVVLWSLDLAVRVWPASRTAVFLFFQIIVTKFAVAAVGGSFSGKSLWAGTLLIGAAMYAEARWGGEATQEVVSTGAR
jgi:drug/metabolite transporter (DMT)-like permease